MQKSLSISIAAMLALSGFAPAARAGELVTLRNGFEMRCSHHGAVEGRVRLFLTKADDNYIDLGQDDIANVEQVPDPPPEPEAIPAPPAAHSQEAKLSPADLREMLTQAGREHNVDVDLLASLVKAESNGQVRAVSRAGARGLMQLMPSTAADLGVHDSFAPDQNVRGGAAYLDALLTRYHDKLALALAAYNAGPAAVDKYHGIPPYRETRAYVARVIHEFNRRVLARQSLTRQMIASVAAPQNKGSR
jgi:soluble lytic murein transglycosylase-like protein